MVVSAFSLSVVLTKNIRFSSFGDPVPRRPAEDIAFSTARFYQLGGTFLNYYMVLLIVIASLLQCKLDPEKLIMSTLLHSNSIMVELTLVELLGDLSSRQAMIMMLQSMNMVCDHFCSYNTISNEQKSFMYAIGSVTS